MTISFGDAAPLFTSFGADLEPQDPGRWSGELELPGPVAQLYRELGPLDVDVPSHGNDVFLPRLAGLWDLQAGYRWHAVSGAPVDWPDELLVVAQQGGDPIAVDRGTGEVQVALAGSGAGRFEPFADGLASAVFTLGVLGSIVDGADELCDDDSLVLPEHVDHAQHTLTDALGAGAAVRILRWTGWLP